MTNISGGTGVFPINCPIGIIYYKDKAGVQHTLETARNLKSIADVQANLNTLRNTLVSKGFEVENTDIIDTLNDVVGGANTADSTLSKYLNAAKNIRAIIRYADADGKPHCFSTKPASSRAAALTDAEKLITTLTGAKLNAAEIIFSDDDAMSDTTISSFFDAR